jgi:hypothetical protein
MQLSNPVEGYGSPELVMAFVRWIFPHAGSRRLASSQLGFFAGVPGLAVHLEAGGNRPKFAFSNKTLIQNQG